MYCLGIFLATTFFGPGPASFKTVPAKKIQGMTISCQTYGREWASPGFGQELARLKSLGINWVAIHPYAGIRADGSIVFSPRSKAWIEEPIRMARAQGMSIMIKPHLAYWSSPFSWRGEIHFENPEQLAHFFRQYQQWLEFVAEAGNQADALVVATELDRTVHHEAAWRKIIHAIRAKSQAKLTYAANWDSYEKVPFWDALDAIGIQAYFPLLSQGAPVTRQGLEEGWRHILPQLQKLHTQTGKPVIFTEIGYDLSSAAASHPWKGREEVWHLTSEEDARIQALCLDTALAVLQQNQAWLRGGFLWKWFVGPAPGENYILDTENLHRLIRAHWVRDSAE